jgi:LEA14-like dessication related protein
MPSRLIRRRLLLAGALALPALLAGCASVGLGWQKPEISLASVRLQNANLLEPRFLLGLRVRNPNAVPLDLEGLDFEVELNGQPFGTGHSAAPARIPAHGEGVVDVSLSTGLGRILRQAGQLLQGGGDLSYRLKGQARIAYWGTTDFDRKGEVPVGKLLGERGKAKPQPQDGESPRSEVF